MKALDTNAIVRFLVRDDEKQAQAIRKILREAEEKSETLYISSPVILETIWVLSSVYKCSKEDIIRALEDLLILPVLDIQSHEHVTTLCRIAQFSKIDLEDIFIGLTALDAGCETTLTFDRKAAKSDLFTLISR